MVLTIFYWLIVCFDVAVLGLFFLLGLAAAPSSKTSPMQVAAFMLVVPGVLLMISMVLFVRSSTPLLRGAGFLLAAAPILVAVTLGGVNLMQVRSVTDGAGKLTFFGAGPMREVTEAIAANDAAKVAALLPQVDVNGRGFQNMTLLTLALRQLRSTPEKLDVLRVMVKAGVDANAVSEVDDLPLTTAIQLSGKAGVEPVALLLQAGAQPNAKGAFGTPAYFGATGKMVPVEVLEMLLDRGADLKAVDRDGKGVVQYATLSGSWRAVRVLLDRGADWKNVRSVDGLGFREMLEAHQRVYGEEPGLKEVMAFLAEKQ